MGSLNLNVVQGGKASAHFDTSSSDYRFTKKEEDKETDSYRLEFAFEKLKELLPQGVMILGGVVGGCALGKGVNSRFLTNVVIFSFFPKGTRNQIPISAKKDQIT